uniref:C-type lectin domain-containing protein n=1 Tax=Musca domestica TaxID=7370 RepID=A0A1I8NIS9_MUSDO
MKSTKLNILFSFVISTIIYSSVLARFYTSDKNNVYFISEQHTHNWFRSFTACSALNMSLVTIEDHAKSQEINRLVLRTFGKNKILWIGAVRGDRSDKFTWITTGEPLVYSFWKSGQPDNFGNAEFCLQIGWGSEMQWNDHQCRANYGYICEYRKRKECNCDDKKRNNVKEANCDEKRQFGNLIFHFNNNAQKELKANEI